MVTIFVSDGTMSCLPHFNNFTSYSIFLIGVFILCLDISELSNELSMTKLSYKLCQGPSSYGSWIYNYLYNQCLSPLMLRVSNLVHGEVYSIQHYVIKFVSYLRQVGGFPRFPPPIKRTVTILLKYCWR